MKRLSEKQARQCENALTTRCRCRCGGALHGVNRNRAEGVEPELSSADGIATREFFEGLPAGDAHRITSDEEHETRRNAANDFRKTKRFVKRLEGDRRRLLELGHTRHAAQLEARLADERKRLEWLAGRAHGS